VEPADAVLAQVVVVPGLFQAEVGDDIAPEVAVETFNLDADPLVGLNRSGKENSKGEAE
jgi:hypothetical protein